MRASLVSLLDNIEYAMPTVSAVNRRRSSSIVGPVMARVFRLLKLVPHDC
jgi:hypothetical protein